MSNLAGLHDRESVAIAPHETWAVDTVALSENPQPTSYRSDLHWITRLNWGYGSTGTLPPESSYNFFAERVAAYVNDSNNCRRWIIGNEPNLIREWPNGQPIFPWHYAACYKLCVRAIHALPGHQADEVLITGSGPWNAELKYAGNERGDWVQYFADVVEFCAAVQIGGFALHAYTHGYDPALVTSTARMDSPFQDRYYNFRTYQDYLRAVPMALAHLPTYITETNGDGPWQAVGLMPAMLQEIDTWNKSGPQKIRCVAFYRYPRYDQYHIEGKDDVIAEYRQAIARGYTSPPSQPIPPQQPQPEPSRDIDPALLARGVHFDFATPPVGTGYWRIVKAEWLDEQEADEVGPDHHILGTVTRNNAEVLGVALRVSWPSGNTVIHSKADEPNALYNYDFPMSASLNEFAIQVDDGGISDKASGIGMGAGGNPGVHTSTWIDFAWTIADGSTPQPQPPDPPKPPTQPSGDLILPVKGTRTQRFGENPQNYARFNIPGHNGVDWAALAGTPIVAPADGIVKFVGMDTDYGFYIRVYHPQFRFHSFMAHMLHQSTLPVGARVKQGQMVGMVGTTGNSSGNHLHYEIRLGTEDSYAEGQFGYGKGRVDPECVLYLYGAKK